MQSSGSSTVIGSGPIKRWEADLKHVARQALEHRINVVGHDRLSIAMMDREYQVRGRNTDLRTSGGAVASPCCTLAAIHTPITLIWQSWLTSGSFRAVYGVSMH
ncbi:hypothetical protein J3459_011360 [Metarhizium acridum]|uniref:uncharacterized protein n=1 Tax=Metarhizium acridum TaxID=92637 RepID=UPI001C6AFB4F|nr:hypothetical protein J3458_021871 [Metarhizium acridum]KAG8420146.1 hypothetical protein J3459_011360 [Metarhizium acridum]